MSTTRLFLDEDSMHHGLTTGLRSRAVDVVTVLDANLRGASDETQLTYAADHGRVLYSCNVRDFCRLHDAWIANGREHAGIVVMARQRYSVGEQLKRLLRLLGSKSAEQMRGQLEFL